MNRSIRVLIAACIFLVFLFSGCASRPDQQLKDATEAYNQAVDLRADLYAPSEWKSAKEIWDQANDQMTKQQYADAASSLITAKARMQKARDVAKSERESMQTQVKDLQSNVAANYDAFKKSMPPAKQVGAAKKEFQAACEDIDKRIAMINSQVAQGDFIAAKENAQGALQAIDYNQKKLAGGAVKR